MIEQENREGQIISRIAGTRIRVTEIVQMYIYGRSSIDWIVENYEVLDYAKVHAALAYYYAYTEQIEQERREIMAKDAEIEAYALTLDKLKARKALTAT